MEKKIIQRALPLTVKYDLVGISYLSVENGGGCGCDNCGRFITNVAAVKSENGIYNIGTDCLESILLNNNLLNTDSRIQYLFSDKPAIAKAKSLRSKILSQQKKESTYQAKLYFKEGEKTFGFSFSAEITRTFFVFEENSREPKKDINGESITEKKTYRDPRGFDFTFLTEYKELTLNYLKGLPGVILE